MKSRKVWRRRDGFKKMKLFKDRELLKEKAFIWEGNKKARTTK